jgi:hypothetical protein
VPLKEPMPLEGGCGKSSCCASTGIHDPHTDVLSGMTFGSGMLDECGYWEFPCHACARAFERLHPEAVPCWPYGEDAVS